MASLSLFLIINFSLFKISCQVMPPPSEFLYSFLSKPNFLPNSSSILDDAQFPEEKEDVVTFTLYVDNWSIYELLYGRHEVNVGNLRQLSALRNLPAKKRSFAIRTAARKVDKYSTSGSISWTLSDLKEGSNVSRFSVGWDINHSRMKDKARIAIGLGELVPDFEEMWTIRDSGRLASTFTAELGKNIVLADSRTTIAAKLVREDSRQKLHYKMLISVVPQNVDVWGWIKYYTEGVQTTSTEPSVPRLTQPQLQISGNKELEGSLPMYTKKYLLQNGSHLAQLQEKNLTLRHALSRNTSAFPVALAIHIENWTRYKLNHMKGENLKDGRPLPGFEPSFIDPGEVDVGIMTNDGALFSGTSGVLSWSLGSRNKVLSVMWSVPYNRQLWRTWSAVGLTTREAVPDFESMYSGRDDTRFVRYEAGYEFEFSDGEFLIIVFMDGGSVVKPVLKVILCPIKEVQLAKNVRRQLGIRLKTPDDMYYDKRKRKSNVIAKSSVSSASFAHHRFYFLQYIVNIAFIICFKRLF